MTRQWHKTEEEQIAEFVRVTKSLLPYHKYADDAADAALTECAAELSMQQYADIVERLGGEVEIRRRILAALEQGK